MSVPFERLYNYLSQLTHGDTIIYQFNPPGSRKITDIVNVDTKYNNVNGWYNLQHCIPMLMHDQEPLNFEYYSTHNIDELCSFIRQRSPTFEKYNMVDRKAQSIQNLNLQIIGHWMPTVCDALLISHSELNSTDVELYKSIGAIGVYWWSHALIAQDWYRYAAYDQSLKFNGNYLYDFNIYNRAWSGTREYRLKFSDLIIESGLLSVSNIKFVSWCNGMHYRNHQYKNKQFVSTCDLEQLPVNTTVANSSADYNSDDYQQCAIDVVLETLFDDSRLHLTEKTLRPIACGKPFILAGTANSLQYLKNYGFKTFGHLIDESYDSEPDPLTRLEKIIATMLKISQMTIVQKNNLFKELHLIAEYNKKKFWSKEFNNTIIDEFKQNYYWAWAQAQQSMQGKRWLSNRIFHSQLSSEFRHDILAPGQRVPKQDLINLLLKLRNVKPLT